ncbi:hypothetical protein, partial [Parasphingorhabdus sp.]|uniref:hypothetical protein n=1 Tax=Parasphingorhabdus sp. TaxID=2709688 RepID=UPI003267AE1F
HGADTGNFRETTYKLLHTVSEKNSGGEKKFKKIFDSGSKTCIQLNTKSDSLNRIMGLITCGKKCHSQNVVGKKLTNP